MDNILIVSASPHMHTNRTTQKIMLDVIIALLPSVIASGILFGLKAVSIIFVSVAFCVLSEYLFNLIFKKKQTVGDLSAIITGIILACSLPVSIPIWQVAIGDIIAIVFVKCCFGGIGHNFANPAATARIVLLLSFTSSTAVGSFPKIADAVSSATPLEQLSNNDGTLPSLLDMFFGLRGGALGEGCIFAILLGAVYLLIKKVISVHAPIAYIGTIFLLFLIRNDFDLINALYWTMGGGAVFASVFMITDYATTPKTDTGKIIFGIGCGIITFAIRAWGSYPEGVTYAILFMNILTPFIEKLTVSHGFGGHRKQPL